MVDEQRAVRARLPGVVLGGTHLLPALLVPLVRVDLRGVTPAAQQLAQVPRGELGGERALVERLLEQAAYVDLVLGPDAYRSLTAAIDRVRPGWAAGTTSELAFHRTAPGNTSLMEVRGLAQVESASLDGTTALAPNAQSR